MTRSTETLTPPDALQQVDMPGAQGSASARSVARSTENHWMRICAIEEIPPLGARVVRQAEGPNIAVFRTATDRFFALTDRCPHRGGPLSQGIVYGERVACPLHNTNVELGSGCAVAPDKGEVRTYAVKVENGTVYIDLGGANERYAYG
jgi:nitrite reductase (NADH) small subunit